ncbi:transmembrane protein, putative (macronuclear) [Tetrahymena thermophila SB210]|uniref:Transmembrane protein, putative n=1 Tax=Tetrahymena thermophila (strain SB210) TaxID=312017 RepID=I7M0B3_TETTS|nr:transmembrane protein, putative [Tetrahymena thermophila SB210]EAR86112.2 transmembrane protein, putative [Tetrahymena thermophila SB210]|eukprot:XP_976707.2 transmembrane protein, putative [Tetrahymena thermophila SB210]
MKQYSLLKFINIQIIIEIATLLFLSGVSTVFGEDCTNASNGQNFNPSQYICALASFQISDFNQMNPNLIFPSSDCKNIKRIIEQGNSYYGTGGDNCDFTQPIVFNFDSSPLYAQRVQLFPVQWVFQSSPSCPTLDISISVNNQAPKFYKLNPSKHLDQGICDYYQDRFTFDNINQIISSVSYTPGLKTKYIEQFYILIFHCPQGCSSCDVSLQNCQSCIDGYYLSGTSCLICDSNCKTCTNTSRQCQSCGNNLYLYTDNTCQSCKSDKVFISGNNCLDCHITCLTCNGVSTQNCKSCPSNNYLYHNNQCTPCIADKVYINSQNCLDCDQSCLTCDGPSSKNCKSCPNGTFLYHNNECVPCTGDKVYIFGTSCLDCDSSCLKCNGTSSNNCISCSIDKYLNNSNQCVSCTGDKVYIDGSKCLDCDQSCLTCNGPSSQNCKSCQTGSYLYNSNQCDPCSGVRKYIDGTNCFDCDISCLTCNGPTSKNCKTCLINSGSATYLYHGNQCISCTGDRVYVDGPNCLDCDLSCLSCNGPSSKDCKSCPTGSYLYHGSQCVPCIGDRIYIDGTNCFDCDKNCLTCYGPASNNCRSCPNGTYLYQNNQCITCADNGKYIKDSFCYDCDQSCQNCNGPLPTNCLSCQAGNYLFADNSCNLCDIYNGFIIQGSYCNSCYKGCKRCFGISKYQCLDCQEEYSLFNQQCIQKYFIYNSQIRNDTMYNIVQLIHDSSQITFLSSLFLSFTNNMAFTSTFAFLMSGFVGQRFSFFLLVDAIFPKYLYEILLALQKQYPTQQLRFMNVFKSWVNQDAVTQYQNLRYEEVNISFNIFQTSGQYAIIFSASALCFFIFYLISAFAKNRKFISYSNLLYDKIFLGLIIQYSELCTMIFIISINQQIKEFIKIQDIQQIGLKVTLLLISFASAGGVFYTLYKYIDSKNIRYDNTDFEQITKKKILDDIIVESKIRNYFILINLLFEAVLIPTIFIQLNEVWQAATSISIAIQLILVVITIYLRPFTTKLNNSLFITNSLLWLLLYVMFLLINIYIQQPFLNKYEAILDAGILSFIVIIFILIFLPSIAMLIQLILWIIDQVIKKKKQNLNQQSSSLNKIIFNKKVDIKIANDTSYILNRYQKEMQISNLFDELMSKRTQMVKFSKKQQQKDLELSQLNL